jgi:hypothetical protein
MELLYMSKIVCPEIGRNMLRFRFSKYVNVCFESFAFPLVGRNYVNYARKQHLHNIFFLLLTTSSQHVLPLVGNVSPDWNYGKYTRKKHLHNIFFLLLTTSSQHLLPLVDNIFTTSSSSCW